MGASGSNRLLWSVTLAVFLIAAVPLVAAGQATPAATPRGTPVASLPAACQAAGGRLVVDPLPFTYGPDGRPDIVGLDGVTRGTFPVPGAVRFTATPDATKVLVDANDQRTWLYDLTTGHARTLGTHTIPAGVFVLFEDGSGWRILDIRNGQERALAEIAGPAARPIADSNAKIIAPGGTSALLMLAPGSTATRTVEGAVTPAFGAVPMVVIPGDLAKATLLNGFIIDFAAAFSADGRQLAFVRYDVKAQPLVVRDLATGAERVLATHEYPDLATLVAFGGDGVVFALRDRLMTVGLDGRSSPRELAALPGHVEFRQVNSAGTAVAFMMRASGAPAGVMIWWLDLHTGMVRQLGEVASPLGSWEETGRWLVLQAPGARSDYAGVAVVDVDAGRMVRATLSPAATPYAIQERLVVTDGGLVVISPLSPAIGAPGPAKIAVVRGATGESWTVSVPGSALSSASEPPLIRVSSLVVSPDGACAAFAVGRPATNAGAATTTIYLLPLERGATSVRFDSGVVIGWLPAK